MKKLLASIILLCLSIVADADSRSDKPFFLLCDETNNSDYRYLVFMVGEDGWLYDAITTEKVRFEAYGTTPYAYQTLSSDFSSNSYFAKSWVHKAGLSYTLLTTSNFSREFSIDMGEEIFQEIDSGVENKHLSGNCAIQTTESLVALTNELESDFHSWVVLQDE